MDRGSAQEAVIGRAVAVIVHTAEVELTVASQMQDFGSVLHGGRYIVGDHDDRYAGLFIDPFHHIIQASGHYGIQARRRLIQQDQLPGRAQGPGQKDSLLLAAGQVPVAAAGQIGNLQSIHMPHGLFLLRGGIKGRQAMGTQKTRHDHFPDAGREILLDLGLLGQIADFRSFQAFPHGNGSRGRFFQLQQTFDQGTLAGAVFTDDTEIISLFHFKIQVMDDGHAVVSKRKVFANK